MAKKQSGRVAARQRKNENNLSEEEKGLLQILIDANIQQDELKQLINTRDSSVELVKQEFLQKKQHDWLMNDFESWKKDFEGDFEEELKSKYQNLFNENESLEKNIKTIREDLVKFSSETKLLKEEKQKIENENKALKNKAEKEAEEIIDKAKKNVTKMEDDAKKKASDELAEDRKQLKNREEQVQKREEDLTEAQKAFEMYKADKEDTLEVAREKIAREERLCQRRENVLKQRMKEYADACPDRVKELNFELEQNRQLLDKRTAQYIDIKKKYDELLLARQVTEDLSSEDLAKRNQQLTAQLERLKEKSERYSDEMLSEMENAYNTRQEREEQIINLRNQLQASKNELMRVNSTHLTTEQELSQLELLRTLNKSLRQELENTRRMIEGSTGDICVSLSDIDLEVSNKNSSHNSTLEALRSNKQVKLSLAGIVEHIKKYAASRTKPLYYSDEDLRAFLAGLSVSRLTILQGMSGTGKTSLPRVFAEAISGITSVIPVESSWRDRNELLGYYNDFSKRFSAKEFTCTLYRAGLETYSSFPYFIVLDEMNLSRVEYYFADFLSVLEADPSEWQIPLVDIDMRQLPTVLTKAIRAAINKDLNEEKVEHKEVIERFLDSLDHKTKQSKATLDEKEFSVADKSKLVSYLASFEKKWKDAGHTESVLQGPLNLIDGKKIRVPKNVWFIGTANRDESTFEITDKVYDRAQVLNFNKRAKSISSSGVVPQLRLTVGHLEAIFNEARRKNPFSVASNEALQMVELELNKVGIAYGNRIADQMEKFVSVYVEAGNPKENKEERERLITEAIDYQLANKVLRKVEYMELSKDFTKGLIEVLDTYGLRQSSEFIQAKGRQ